jgi:hypothetical protein
MLLTTVLLVAAASEAEFCRDDSGCNSVSLLSRDHSFSKEADQAIRLSAPFDPTKNPAPWSLADVTKTKRNLQKLMNNLVKDGGGQLRQGRSAWQRAVEHLFSEGWPAQPCQVENTGTCQDAGGKGCKFFECNDKENVTQAAGVEMATVNGKSFWYGKGSTPSAPKFLRLAFHDCMKDSDGTGGCDGCMSFDGMYTLKNMDQTYIKINAKGKRSVLKSKHKIPPQGNNVGLAPTADLLERFYSDKEYMQDEEGRSLKEGGKSRADLWALASLVAVENMIKYSNSKCGTPDHPYSYPETMGLPEGFKCEMTLREPLKFQWGRKDCPESASATPLTALRPFQKNGHEEHPDAHDSGKTTARYFKDNFDFSGRETVAIMGAHSVGDFHSHLALFRYTWMGRETGQAQALMLNNLYYRYMAMRPALAEEDRKILEGLRKKSEPLPGPGKAHWLKVSRGLSPGGGPWQWFFNLVPANKSLGMHQGRMHNTMLNSDIGLYLNFDTKEGGAPVRPHGDKSQCSAVSGSGDTSFRANDVASCRQDAESGDGKTLADVVEEYADDQDIWINDFVAAFTKMLGNGQSGLRDVDDTDGVDIYTVAVKESPYF